MYVQKKAPVDPVSISATMMSRRLLYYKVYNNGHDMSTVATPSVQSGAHFCCGS
jgi:hypothetical protein